MVNRSDGVLNPGRPKHSAYGFVVTERSCMLQTSIYSLKLIMFILSWSLVIILKDYGTSRQTAWKTKLKQITGCSDDNYFFVTLFAAKNVLLTAEGSRAKLADFDSSKRLPHELTVAGLTPLGTKGFASPEVRTGFLSLEKCYLVHQYGT